MRTPKLSAFILFLAPAVLCGCPEEGEDLRRYAIEVRNISSHPMSPVVAASHVPEVAMWEEGQHAGPGIGGLAMAGELSTLIDDLQARGGVTEVAYTVLPLPAMDLVVPRFGVHAGSGPDLTDTQTLEIDAVPGDVLSLAGGLLGTNDGFWGIDRAVLPESGSSVYFAFGYDAGIEENNELEAYINDDASRLGPEPIPGDEPDDEVEEDNRSLATAPPNGIRRHDGVLGVGDVPASYDFDDVILRIEVTRVPLIQE